MNRRLIPLLGALLTACALTACGSSSSSSTSSASAAAGTAGTSAARSKLVTCLKAHGVTLPTHRPGPGGFRGGGAGGPGRGGGGFFGGGAGGGPGGGGRFANPKFRAAFQACGANFRGRQFNPATRRTEIENFVKCVNEHGYKLPQPNFSGHGSVFPAKIATDPKFRAASRACLGALRRPVGPPATGSPPST